MKNFKDFDDADRQYLHHELNKVLDKFKGMSDNGTLIYYIEAEVKAFIAHQERLGIIMPPYTINQVGNTVSVEFLV